MRALAILRLCVHHPKPADPSIRKHLPRAVGNGRHLAIAPSVCTLARILARARVDVLSVDHVFGELKQPSVDFIDHMDAGICRFWCFSFADTGTCEKSRSIFANNALLLELEEVTTLVGCL